MIALKIRTIRISGASWTRVLFGLVATIALTSAALAKDYYVASPNSSMVSAADGTKEAPWPDLSHALKSEELVEGDRIRLLDGDYGHVILRGLQPSFPIEVIPVTPGSVFFSSLLLDNSKNIYFQNVKVWPKEIDEERSHLVFTARNTDNITFKNFDVRGRADSPHTYMSWSKKDWGDWGANAFHLRGTRNHVIDSNIVGVGFGIDLLGDNSSAIGNRIEGFSYDGIRGLGNQSHYRNNHIENCFSVNENHDDGFQSWAPFEDPAATRKVSGMVIEANTILEWTGPADHPLRCTLQGIGMFDGAYEDTIIRNNLVVVSAYHGISVYAGRNVQIVHNTVVHPSGNPGGYPWILLKDHKSGFPASGNLIANNIGMSVTNQSSDKTAVPARTNFKTRYPMRYYRDILGGDFRLKPDSNIIGAANPAYAPETDIEGKPRPQGKGPDFGAYEMP